MDTVVSELNPMINTITESVSRLCRNSVTSDGVTVAGTLIRPWHSRFEESHHPGVPSEPGNRVRSPRSLSWRA
eukprot:267691-Hanusia_phi.AAC.1